MTNQQRINEELIAGMNQLIETISGLCATNASTCMILAAALPEDSPVRKQIQTLAVTLSDKALLLAKSKITANRSAAARLKSWLSR